MTITEDLFRKYLEGKANPEEVRMVEIWLHRQHPEGLDELLSMIWNERELPMPEEQQAQLWQKLRAATGQTHAADSVPMYSRWSSGSGVAAAVVAALLLTGGVWWMNRRDKTTERQITAQTALPAVAPDPWTISSNPGIGHKKVKLGDGSEITLEARSKIRYLTGFEKDRRSIYLEGTALFSVAKDQARPFTVYSGNIATTALGTVFLVNMDSARQAVNVSLYHGRIVIHPIGSAADWTALYLSPGQQLSYNNLKLTATVSRKEEMPDRPGEGQMTDPNTLQFVNSPLAKVFDRLSEQYHQTITYHMSDLYQLDFTGTFNKNASLPMLLRIIANMNRLQIVLDGNGFVVTKPH
jgi:transmembrane sensor